MSRCATQGCSTCPSQAYDGRRPDSEPPTEVFAWFAIHVLEAVVQSRVNLIRSGCGSRYSSDDDPVFAARNGKPLKHRNATLGGFELAAEKAGITGVTFHSMRHACASRMIDRGISSTRTRGADGARVEHDHRAPLRPLV